MELKQALENSESNKSKLYDTDREKKNSDSAEELPTWKEELPHVFLKLEDFLTPSYRRPTLTSAVKVKTIKKDTKKPIEEAKRRRKSSQSNKV